MSGSTSQAATLEGSDTRSQPVSGPPTVRRHRLAVSVLSLVAAAIYAACEFLQFYRFRSGTYDLVLFDQAVRSYSHFRLPVAIAAGVHRGFGTGFSLLGDHFSPILALLAPLYWIHSGPQTLLVAQALLFAAAVPPLWVFVRRELGAAWPAYAVALGYLLSWPVAQAVSFDFHEVAFAPLLTAVLFERFSAYRACRASWWQVALPALGLLLVKEDMGLLVAGFGLAVLVRSWGTPLRARRSIRWLGGGFVVAGLGAAVVATGLVLPAFGSKPMYYWRYGEFGSSVPSAAWHLITHPLAAAVTFVTPEPKLHTMVCLFGLTGFLALGSPYLLTVLPLLADRMLADAPNWWGLDFHYNAYLVVPVLCAGVDTMARLVRWSARPGRRPSTRRAGPGVAVLWSVLVPVVALALVPSFAFAPLTHPSSWQRDASQLAAAAAVRQVPSGVTVEAANNLGPRLTGRTTVLLWDRLPRWAPWVVAEVGAPVFPFCGRADQQRRVVFLEQHGYRVVFADDGYLVLHNTGPLPALDTARSPGCT